MGVGLISLGPIGVEGRTRARWILVDFGDVVAHVFQEEVREFYALERLWGEAEQVELDLGAEAAARLERPGRAVRKALPGG